MPGNFQNVPPSVIASWPTPNYVDPVKRTWLPAMIYVLVSISTTLILGRFYLRARSFAGQLGYDDFFIFVGWAVSIGFAASAVLGSERYYLSVHTWDVPYQAFVPTALNGFIAQLLFIVSTCATKASILLFYRRMAKNTYNPRWRYAIWAALAFTAAFFVALLITYGFICQPLDSYWKSYNFDYNVPYKCLNGNILSPISGALSIVSDLYATFLPWTMLQHYDLDVPKRQKIALNVIFSLSLIVAGCGGGRLYYLWKMNHTYDTSWTGYDLFVWSSLECHLAVIFACAPALRAFFRHYLQDPINRNFRSRRSGSVPDYQHQQKSPYVSARDISAHRNSGATITAMPAVINATPPAAHFEKPREEEQDAGWSRRSSDTFPRISSAEEYESFNMMQLQRHGYKRSSNSMLSNARSEASIYKLV